MPVARMTLIARNQPLSRFAMSAKFRAMAPRRHRVVSVLVDGMTPLEPAVTDEFFGLDHSELRGVAWYRHTACSADGAVVRIGTFSVSLDHGLEAVARADTVIIPGWCAIDRRAGDDLVEALQRAVPTGSSHRVVLHGRVRPRGRRAARRPARDDALGLRRRIPPPLPESGPRSCRPVHRRRAGADFSRSGRIHRPLDAPHSARLRHRDRQHRRPQLARTSSPARRTSAVRGNARRVTGRGRGRPCGNARLGRGRVSARGCASPTSPRTLT